MRTATAIKFNRTSFTCNGNNFSNSSRNWNGKSKSFKYCNSIKTWKCSDSSRPNNYRFTSNNCNNSRYKANNHYP